MSRLLADFGENHGELYGVSAAHVRPHDYVVRAEHFLDRAKDRSLPSGPAPDGQRDRGRASSLRRRRLALVLLLAEGPHLRDQQHSDHDRDHCEHDPLYPAVQREAGSCRPLRRIMSLCRGVGNVSSLQLVAAGSQFGTILALGSGLSTSPGQDVGLLRDEINVIERNAAFEHLHSETRLHRDDRVWLARTAKSICEFQQLLAGLVADEDITPPLASQRKKPPPPRPAAYPLSARHVPVL